MSLAEYGRRESITYDTSTQQNSSELVFFATVASLYFCAHFLKILNVRKNLQKFCIINRNAVSVRAAWQFKMFAY